MTSIEVAATSEFVNGTFVNRKSHFIFNQAFSLRIIDIAYCNDDSIFSQMSVKTISVENDQE